MLLAKEPKLFIYLFSCYSVLLIYCSLESLFILFRISALTKQSSQTVIQNISTRSYINSRFSNPNRNLIPIWSSILHLSVNLSTGLCESLVTWQSFSRFCTEATSSILGFFFSFSSCVLIHVFRVWTPLSYSNQLSSRLSNTVIWNREWRCYHPHHDPRHDPHETIKWQHNILRCTKLLNFL